MTAGTLLPAGLRAPALLAGAGGRAPSTTRSRRVTVPGAGFDLPAFGPCRHLPVLLILLFDDSPSVVGTHDTAGDRYREAGIAVDQFRRRCQCRRELVAVRTFDRRTEREVGPVHLDADGWQRVSVALAWAPGTAEGTSRLRPALLAAEKLAHAHPRHRTTLVVVSDFELLDGAAGRVMDRLAEFPGDAHALVLDAEPPARLRSSRVAVTRVTATSPHGEVARAVVAALGAGGAVRLVPAAGAGAGSQ